MSDLNLIRHSFPSDIEIYPVADVHLGAIECNLAEWEAFIKRVKQENAYLFLVGDMLNNNLRSVKFANPFDETLRPRNAKRRMADYLEPLKDHILCVTSGNHEARTVRESDQDPTLDICSKLDLEDVYRETIAILAISIGKRTDEPKPNATYTFAVTHGSFGGQLTGGAVNKNERFAGMVFDGLDCLVTGHVHKGFVTRPTKLVIDVRNGTVTPKAYTVVSCESWLDYGGYAARGMMLPAENCKPQKLHLANNKTFKRITVTW